MRRGKKSCFYVLATILFLPTRGTSQDSSEHTPVRPTKETYLKLAEEVEAALRRDVLDVWFPRNVDNQNGGFYSGFDRKWQPTPSEGKFSVFQGRMRGFPHRPPFAGLIDSEFHGVYQEIGPDGSVEDATKGQIWKAAYHDGRALLNVSGTVKKAGRKRQIAS